MGFSTEPLDGRWKDKMDDAWFLRGGLRAADVAVHPRLRGSRCHPPVGLSTRYGTETETGGLFPLVSENKTTIIIIFIQCANVLQERAIVMRR